MTTADPRSDVSPAAFGESPWLDLRRADFGPANAVPTMLSPKERKFYLWLSQAWAGGDGAIVDLGSFVGGSTACLAQGRARGGHAAPIHAYDRFRASGGVKKKLLYPAGIAPIEGPDVYDLARHLLAPFSPPILLHRGDIEHQGWSGERIDLLCIDAAKSDRLADHIARTFFPHLVPGRSIVIQQDYLHWKVPWIPAQMEWLSSCFLPVAVVPGNTVAFLCTRRPVPEDLKRAQVTGQADHALQAGILGAAARLAPWGVEERIARQQLALELNPGVRVAKGFKERPQANENRPG